MTLPQNPEKPLPFPTEITAEIFQFVVSVDFDVLVPLIYEAGELPEILSRCRDHPTTPLTLGAVCRSWRSFVWGIPSLWSIITINFPKDRHSTQLDILNMWLSNSTTCPLTIISFCLSEQYFGGYHWVGIPLSALEMIAEHSERWENIALGEMDGKCIEVLQRIDRRTQSLRTLYVRLGSDYWQFNICMFHDSPLLRELALSPYRPSIMTFPLHQLTTLTLCGVDQQCIDMLALCPNLQGIRLILVYSRLYHLLEKMERITLPQLRSLAFSDCHGGTMNNVMNSICCPELRELRLCTSRLEFSEALFVPYQVIEDMVLSSQSPLETLELDFYYCVMQSRRGTVDFPDDYTIFSFIFPVLEKLSSLKKLILRQKPVTDNFLDQLILKLNIEAASPIFLPQLIEFQYTTPDLVHLTKGNDLVKILKQRLNPPAGVARLQSFVINAKLEFPDSDVKSMIFRELGELGKAGMRISVTGIDL